MPDRKEQLRERGILFAFATSRSARASARFKAMLTPITSGGAICNEAQVVVDYVCDTNDNDGVAKWIEENVL